MPRANDVRSDAEHMRLFVGLFPPDAVTERLAMGVADARGVDDGSVRWTMPEQWHISLAFLGSVPETTVAELRRRLGRAAARHGPVELRIAGAGAFSSPRRARVVWAGIEGDVEALRRLAGSVAAGARRSGVTVERRPFRPHLTVGRLSAPADVTGLLGPLGTVTTPAWTADQIALVRSHLGQGSGRRSRYETVDRWTLGGQG